MKFVALSVIFFILFISFVSAFEVTLNSNATEIIYPNSKEMEVYVEINKGMIDDIEDINYNLIISGPATFEDNTQYKTKNYEELDETKSNIYKIILQDSQSADKQKIIFTIEGSYIKNSLLFGGGKKDFFESKEVSYISTEKGKILEEKNQLAEENKDLQDEINIIKINNTKYQLENKKLLQNLSELKTELEECQKEDNNILIVIISILVVIIFILIIVIIKYKDKCEKLKHQLNRFHY